MSNVIALNVPSRRLGAPARRAALVESFARHRRFGDDVFWLKENAELLNILECTGLDLGPDALAPHEGFYADIERRLGFFPQYYRFFLSICLDLEDLGMPGDKGEALCRWAAREGLADAELSDLQRAEARRLMLRRGIDPLPEDAGLEDRLRLFMDRSETFAMPNKKAAYELTHIVFYLSEYGRRDPGLSAAAAKSLEFAGILAFLDQNVDLLAEICVAMRHAGIAPSSIWEDWLEQETRRFAVLSGARADTGDEYHEFLVCNWAMAVSGRPNFVQAMTRDRMSFHRPAPSAGPLREVSQCMFRLDDARSDDWETMRPLVFDAVTETGQQVLAAAEASSTRFAEFFSGFARTGLRGGAL
ncbi:DUF6902 family protein [Jhaorihella thermophila]|uniref:Uncharacterized protein n=1 Tax=Jhaorihella thermophila TaxID=488547 RepID=A0A1H5RXC9_9RHOB|nr:hypothetical protein [Jhaorihella thermophila]SEF42880.1 hypothetical protein SAMN05421751_101215 [Jhaorihella thermophila]